MAAILLAATPLVPLILLAACLSADGRRQMPAMLIIAPLPALAAALLAPDALLILDPGRFRFTLMLDTPSAVLLGTAAALWSGAGAYATTYLGRSAATERFSAWWLLMMSGSLGVFVAGDLVSFYLCFAVLSLVAYALVVHDRTERARRAGSIYLLLAVLGEISLLGGFAILADMVPGDSLAIADVVAILPQAPLRDLAVLLLLGGFGLKAGLVPLHVWLPLAHPAAPMPASAVLSGVIVKAGIVGLIRFLPYDGSLPGWGEALGVMGLITAFYGVALGVTQANPKTVLAYSSVSQMGVVMAALGLGLASGQAAAPLDAAFYAAHHVLAKGALFLAVGAAYAAGPRRLFPILALVVLLVLSFGGFPLTGGALAKAAVKDQLGAGVPGLLSALSAAGTTLLMLHFTGRLTASTRDTAEGWPPAGMMLPWLGLTAAAMIVPWALFTSLEVGRPEELLQAGALWKAIWPVLLGAGLAALLARFGPLPALPEGDVLVFAERGFNGVAPQAGRAADRLEATLSRWPVAGLALLLLLLVLGAAMVL